MIRHLKIQNFKSIKKIGLSLGKLNLFFGMNGMGKSSTIQALLLCRQSFWKGNHNVDKLFPNGDLINLGTASDIYCMNANDSEISFSIKYEGEDLIELFYEYNPLDVHALSMERDINQVIRSFDYSLFNENFVYLSAEHIGPQRKYNYSDWTISGINKFGNHGEYVVPFLAMYGKDVNVEDSLCLDIGRTNSLIDQVSAWMTKISPGIRINTELLSADQDAKLNISFEGERFVSNPYSPVNVGFGIPYVLPIIVSLLAVRPGGLVLIENPESHLHPKGQAAMAQLIALAANSGVQIICESHSDHIINGVRVAVKDGIIPSDDVVVDYFEKDIQQNTKVSCLYIDKFGNLDKYPKGLLDEWGELMSRLL